MGLAWGVGFYLTRYLFEKNNLNDQALLPFFAGVFATSWIGAKLFFLIFSSENKIYQYLYADSFWLGGGFVFYGGLIFALGFYLIYSLWLKKISFDQSKYLAPGLIFGHAIGRVGCFFTGCCYGSQCDLPWAVRMHGGFVHPVQLYEAIGLFFLGYFSLKWLQKQRDTFYVLTRYLLFYSLLRFTIEFFRGDSVRGVHFNLFSTSQLISLCLFLTILLAMLMKSGMGKNRPGPT